MKWVFVHYEAPVILIVAFALIGAVLVAGVILAVAYLLSLLPAVWQLLAAFLFFVGIPVRIIVWGYCKWKEKQSE